MMAPENRFAAILRQFSGGAGQTERRAECADGRNHRRSARFRYEVMAIRDKTFDGPMLGCVY